MVNILRHHQNSNCFHISFYTQPNGKGQWDSGWFMLARMCSKGDECASIVSESSNLHSHYGNHSGSSSRRWESHYLKIQYTTIGKIPKLALHSTEKPTINYIPLCTIPNGLKLETIYVSFKKKSVSKKKISDNLHNGVFINYQRTLQ